MNPITFDCETAPINEGLTFPPLVCLAVCNGDGEPDLLDAVQARAWFAEAIADKSNVWVGHNVGFDLGVMANETGTIHHVLQAYADGRVHCTQIRQKLLVLATTGELDRSFSLAACAKDEGLGIAASLAAMKKGSDSWRLRYNALANLPLAEWPEAARVYPCADVETTRALFRVQVAKARATDYGAPDGRSVHDEHTHNRADFILKLASSWGMRTHPARVAAVRADYEQQEAAAREALQASGLLRQAGSVNTGLLKQIVEAWHVARGLQVPTTAGTGAVVTSKQVLADIDDDRVKSLLALRHAQKRLSTYVGPLEAGRESALCCSFNPLVASGRVSCTRPNMQNWPVKGALRGCFEPRAGNAFGFVDLNSAELRAWADTCLELLGFSTLAEWYQRDPRFDPHAYLGAELIDTTYERFLERLREGDEQASEARRLAKPGNFGFPVGMGVEKFVTYARGYGLELTEEQGHRIREGWRKAWPEGHLYLDKVIASKCAGGDGKAVITQLVSGRRRAGCWFTRAANTYFQGLIADGTKRFLWVLGQEIAAGRVRARLVNFIHDEVLLELPDDEHATRTMDAVTSLLVSEMGRVIKRVPIVADPVLSRRWTKDAYSTRCPDGTLTVWEPTS